MRRKGLNRSVAEAVREVDLESFSAKYRKAREEKQFDQVPLDDIVNAVAFAAKSDMRTHQIAALFGHIPQWVSAMIAVLRFSTEVKQVLSEGYARTGYLDDVGVRFIASSPPELRLKRAQNLVSQYGTRYGQGNRNAQRTVAERA